MTPPGGENNFAPPPQIKFINTPMSRTVVLVSHILPVEVAQSARHHGHQLSPSEGGRDTCRVHLLTRRQTQPAFADLLLTHVTHVDDSFIKLQRNTGAICIHLMFAFTECRTPYIIHVHHSKCNMMYINCIYYIVYTIHVDASRSRTYVIGDWSRSSSATVAQVLGLRDDSVTSSRIRDDTLTIDVRL